jgi:soluble lytic murein transglycosylase-like protein
MAVHQIATAITVVEQAVKTASDATGVNFDFLMRTARRESGFDPSATASTSSAAGLFQFTEQTWLKTLKRHGSAHGFARYADLIREPPMADSMFPVMRRGGR